MTFGDPPNGDMFFKQWEKTSGFDGAARRQQDVLCVNPISGTKDGVAPPQDNPGTLVPTTDLRSATLQPALVGARCDKGLLILNGTVPLFTIVLAALFLADEPITTNRLVGLAIGFLGIVVLRRTRPGPML